MTFLAAFLLGLLVALPLAFESLGFLSFVSLSVFLLLSVKVKTPYRHGLLFSLGYYGVAFSWLTALYPMDFAGFSPLVSILLVALAWVFLSILQGVALALVPKVFSAVYTRIKPALAPLAAASVWCLVEAGQELFWFGVPWARLAMTQLGSPLFSQSLSLVGSLGLGFLLVLFNGELALLLDSLREKRRIDRAASLAMIALLLFQTVYGSIALLSQPKEENSFTVAVIQGNLSSSDKWADSSVANSLDVYSSLTREAVAEASPTLVVWPETVLVVSLNRYDALKYALSALAKECNVHLAVGAFYTDEQESKYNALYLYHPDGTLSESVYYKRHLVPFGEYLPMAELLTALIPSLRDINQIDSDLTPGTDSALFDTDLGSLGALICFDSIFPSLARDAVCDGAELLTLSTNDSWYKDSIGVYQHNRHARMRAIESCRYLLRAANTGISSILSPTGEVLSSLEPLKTGYVTAEVACRTTRTPYSYVGDAIVPLSFVFLAVLLGHFLVKKMPLAKRKTVDKA